MYLKEFLSRFNNKKIVIYVDMDGVIADYDVTDKFLHYDNKRPLYTSIKKLEEISHLPNVELHILSVTRKTIGRLEKNNWLDQYASFFKVENRNIISKEENYALSSELKLNFLKNLDIKDKIIVLIDDDPLILKTINKELKNIVLLKDTALVD